MLPKSKKTPFLRAGQRSPVPPELERTPPPASWESLSPPKQELLLRVKSNTLAHMDDMLASSSVEAKTLSIPRWLIPAMGTALAALALVLVFTQRKPPSTMMTSLQTDGHAKLEWPQSSNTLSAQLRATVPANKSARLAMKQTWHLNMQGGTSLRLQQTSAQRVQVTLEKGSVQAYVKPKALQDFQVRCSNGVSVHVRGTQFSIRQGPDWLRAEVSHGKVELQHEGKSLAFLQAGQGLRWSSQGTFVRYKVPTNPALSLSAKLRWMKNNQPAQLLSYANDIASETEWSLSQRLDPLKVIADLLKQMKQYRQAKTLWYQIYHLKPHGHDGQAALFHAAFDCYRSKATRAICAPIYREFLVQFPQAPPAKRNLLQRWLQP